MLLVVETNSTMTAKGDKPLENLDDLFNKLGRFGRFQIVAFFGLLLIYCPFAFSVMQMVYAGMAPNWYCNFDTSKDVFQSVSRDVKEVQENTSDFAVKLTTSMVNHEIEPGNLTFKVCYVNGTQCDRFKFIGSSRTVVTEWSLVCNMHWVKQTIISVQMAGLFFGTIISGQLGDQFGRKKVLYASLLMSSIIECVTGFSNSWKMFTACKFFSGSGFGIIAVVAYPFLLELSPQGLRSLLAAFPAFTLGGALFAGAAYILGDWSSLHFMGASLVVPFLFGWFFFPESPRWLAVHDKQHEAMKAVENMFRFNGKPVPPGILTLITKIANQEKNIRQTGRLYTIFDIFSTFQAAKTSLILGFMGCSTSVVTYGIAFGISSLHGNLFLNMFLMTVLQTPFQLTIACTLNRFGRRYSTIFYFLISILLSAGCWIMLLTVKESSSRDTVISGLCLASRITVGTAFNITALWCTELYPTVVRNLGYSFFICAFRAGGILAPFIINFDGMRVVSYAIITVLLVICAVLTLLTRETNHMPLAESTDRAVTLMAVDDMFLQEVTDDNDCPPANPAKA